MFIAALSPDRVRVRGAEGPGNKREALSSIAELLGCPENALDTTMVLAALDVRERIASTAVGGGIAMPHGRVEGLSETRVAIEILREGVDFNSADDDSVHLVVGMVSPREAVRDHLLLLTEAARLFRRESVVASLVEADSALAAFEILVGA